MPHAEFFADPTGDIREFSGLALSTWGNDEDIAHGFFAGYFAALRAYGIPCPIDTDDIHARATWATRQILSAGLSDKSLSQEPAANNEEQELQKARSIIQHLQFDHDQARHFLTGTLPNTGNVLYYDPHNPSVILDTSEDDGLIEANNSLIKVSILRAKFDDGIDYIIRSDDAAMIRALTEYLDA